MTPVNRGREEEARITREVTERAIRRLDVLEWIILTGAGVLSAVGGWLVALVLSTAVGFPFRPVWIVASLLMFGIPGLLVLRRLRREERERQKIKTGEDKDV